MAGRPIVAVRKRVLLTVAALAGVVLMTFLPPFWRTVYPIYYYPAIQNGARAARVDPLLVAALARVESHFREDDVSHAGAVGLMQLMPKTAVWLSGRLGWPKPSVAQLADPLVNVRLGSQYIAYLLQMFHYHLPEAIAAYNAGPNRVAAWLASGTWSGDEVTIEDIPVQETRHFVARVLYTYQMFHRFY